MRTIKKLMLPNGEIEYNCRYVWFYIGYQYWDATVGRTVEVVEFTEPIATNGIETIEEAFVEFAI